VEKYALIVAGGKGKRMGQSVPKQFLLLEGKPILFHTIDSFKRAFSDIKLVIVLPKDHVDRWKSLTAGSEYSTIPLALGGAERTDSVRSGLKLIPEGTLVGIHDAVRPFASVSTIQNAYSEAEARGNGIPVIELTESIRQLDSTHSKAVDRSKYRIVQTPQCFQSDLIKKAYQEFTDNQTDDASVLEAYGEKINLVDGNKENIKITQKEDLKIAEALLKK